MDARPLIRRARGEDAAVLAALGAATFTETFGHLYAPEDLATFLATSHAEGTYGGLLGDPAVATWIAELPGTGPIGYAIAGRCKLPVEDLEPAAGEMRQLYVLGAHQKLRLGTRLLGIALDWLAGAGYDPLYVGVWSQNHGAQRLYARFGFTKVGEYGFPVGRHVDREFILRRSPAV